MMIVISISYHFCAPDARAFYKFFDKDGKSTAGLPANPRQVPFWDIRKGKEKRAPLFLDLWYNGGKIKIRSWRPICGTERKKR